MNTNLAYEDQEEKKFIINNDNAAEWALKKISEEKAETQRLVNVCNTGILEYQKKIEDYNKQLENKISNLKSQLNQYFQTVPHKSTKTQETYKLPSGTLKLKFPQPEFKRDDEKLIKWLKENNQDNFIKVKESADWSELKKVVTVQGGSVVDSDGVIVEGVTVEEKPPVFDVDL
jgi:phage host-nuclease inhibitor protein Gam